MSDSTAIDSSLRYLKMVWIAFNTVILTVIAVTDPSWAYAYHSINWKLFLLEIVLVPCVAYLGSTLYFLNPPLMGFGLGTILSYLTGRRIEGTNISLLGVDIKYFGIIFCLLLMTILPYVAAIEEVWFRAGTTDWSDGLWRSLLFGFVHMIVGVPLCGAIVLTGMGLVFTQMYFVGGLPLAMQGHFQYDFILVLVLFLMAVDKSFGQQE